MLLNVSQLFNHFHLTILLVVMVFGAISCNKIKIESRNFKGTNGPGEPLLLTPLIENGKISEARNKASVRPLFHSIESYAGYFTVNKNFNSNLFFWFFKAQDSNWENLPVAVWLEGGPGTSSLYGLFLLNGPYVIKDKHMHVRLHSWHNQCNMIYIDNPVGTGFSFTDTDDGYARNQTVIGEELYSMIEQFFIMFPNLLKNDFFLTGESYAGKYIPTFAYTIHKNNALATPRRNPSTTNRVFINLKGLLIGNGLVDPINMLNYGDYLYQLGLIDMNALKTFHKYEKEIKREIKKESWNKSAYLISKLIVTSEFYPQGSLFENTTGIPQPYNYVDLNIPKWRLQHEKFVNNNEFRRYIHVGNTPFNDGKKVSFFLKRDILQSVVGKVEDLLNHYRIVFYNGQFDVICAYPLTVNFIKRMKWKSAHKYAKAKQHIWRVNSDIAGYYKTAGNLTEILMRNAGHMVPYDQPIWTHVLFNKFITNTELNEL